MTPQIFSVASIFINVALCIAILFRHYKQHLTIPLFCASVVFPLIPLIGIQLFESETTQIVIPFLFTFLSIGIVLLDDISSRFMRKNVPEIKLWGIVLPISSILYSICLIGIVISLIAPWDYVLIQSDVAFLGGDAFELVLLVLLVGLSIYGLYMIELTYRFALDYQRKVGHLCFLSFLILWVFNILFLGKILLYHTLDLNWILTSLSVYGVVYPLLLLGFFRYRLNYERVFVNRNAVYTSIVFAVGGAVFTGVGIFTYFFRFYNIDRSYFEKSLVVVAFFIFITVVISSGGMRRWVIEFVNQRFYSNKYDYREQFFHLYKTYMSGTSLEESLTGMVENMKYAVAAVDAFVFLKSTHNDSYVMHRNPEFTTEERVIIAGNEFPDSVFTSDGAPLYLLSNKDKKRENEAVSLSLPAIVKLAPSVLFPIFNDGVLLGILMVKLSDGRVLDHEDIALVNVFTHSIGMVVYRNILVNEKIEREQFQSFHQVVSFVIHDIKNQIATLSLLSRNAVEYIGDQNFQKSLIRSIGNSVENLTALVNKLSEKRDAVNLKVVETGLVSCVEAALDQGNFSILPKIEIVWRFKEDCSVLVDPDVMKNIIFNIVKNAIEAMASKGKVILSVGKGDSFNVQSLNQFGLAQGELSEKKTLVIIEDTGPGMSQEFLDKWIFKPFVTTKDKGMGIGLYQCKVAIEKMGGRIYCYSKPGEGTAFCVLV